MIFLSFEVDATEDRSKPFGIWHKQQDAVVYTVLKV